MPTLGLVVAREIAGDEFQMRAGAVAIAFRADQAHSEPVICSRAGLARAFVAKELRVLSVVADEKIEPAVASSSKRDREPPVGVRKFR